MSAREFDRFRRAQERFQSQQEQDVPERAQERREREETDESAFDRGLREAAERQDRDDDDDRDVRPGRGTEERVVEREPSPQPEQVDTVEPTAPPERPPRAGSQIEPSTEPEPQPEPIDLPEVDVRQELEQASEAIRGEFQEPPPDIANIGEVIATGAEPEFIEPGGFRTGAVQAAGTIADVPGTALGLESIGRFGAERIGEAAAGDPDLAVQRTAQTADRAIQEGIRAFEEEPVRLGTQVAGSLALSAGAFGAASAIGPRAGTAARFAIQPGEEILGRGGFAATRAVRGESAAQRFFPNQEPLIFSEEAALRAARRVRGADVGFRGVGAGIPAFEVELESETEPEIDRDAFETETLLVESERLRGELEEELMVETEPFVESELELQTPLRTELDFFQEAEAEGIGLELEPVELEIAEIESELLSEAEAITETELELVGETIAEADQEQELELIRELEFEPRREVEPLGVELPLEPQEVQPVEVDFRGVRAVEAFLRPAELDLE
jgi:hypothetical protein